MNPVVAKEAQSGDTIRRAALIGAGLIGRSWAIVFARAGYQTVLYDRDVGVAARAVALVGAALKEMQEFGLVDDWKLVQARIRAESDLPAALAGADWIQESAPENIEIKRQIFSELDRAAPPAAIIASSSSGFPVSAFAEGCTGRHRMLIAHPVNPPHLAPLVEIVPAAWTDRKIADAAVQMMNEAGQEAVLVRGEIDGFILNRLQGAVLDEAFRLVAGGYVSAEDLDRTMVYGLAPRWSFMGPFETIDLNAPGGVRDYANRYGAMYHRFERDRPSVAESWDEAAVLAVDGERRSKLPLEKIPERSSWRDRTLMRLAAARACSRRENTP